MPISLALRNSAITAVAIFTWVPVAAVANVATMVYTF
jgi:hypothetical protein